LRFFSFPSVYSLAKMSNKIKAKTEKKTPYKSLRYRLRVEKAKTPVKIGFFRRIFRLIFNRITVMLSIFMLLAAGLTFGYFWVEYSEKVDMLLRGEVFTKNAGVYSAPKLVKDGEGITKDGLVEYLKSAGYVEKNSQADEKRSRYKIEVSSILV